MRASQRRRCEHGHVDEYVRDDGRPRRAAVDADAAAAIRRFSRRHHIAEPGNEVSRALVLTPIARHRRRPRAGSWARSAGGFAGRVRRRPTPSSEIGMHPVRASQRRPRPGRKNSTYVPHAWVRAHACAARTGGRFACREPPRICRYPESSERFAPDGRLIIRNARDHFNRCIDGIWLTDTRESARSSRGASSCRPARPTSQ